MSVSVELDSDSMILNVRVSGKLTKDDYVTLAPQLEKYVEQHGRLRVLLQTDDFHGWEATALWEDIKFSVRHFNDIERLAMVGEKKWEKGMAMFCKPFTTASIRYFDHDQLEEARSWVAERET